jgi:hypothetical protein
MDSIKHFGKLVGIYLVSIILGTLFLLFLFQTQNIHAADVLFFRAGYFILVTTTLVIISLVFLKIRLDKFYKFFYWRDLALISLIFFFLNWNIYGLIPFNVSRSNSAIILGYLYQNQGTLKSKIDIKNYSQKKYFEDYDAVGVRISEQIQAGNIESINGNYVITKKGILIAKVFKNITYIYKEKNNFLSEKN